MLIKQSNEDLSIKYTEDQTKSADIQWMLQVIAT